jgi:hypothetical protein
LVNIEQRQLSGVLTRINDTLVLRVLRNVVGNRPFVGLDWRVTRLEFVGYFGTRVMWHVEQGSRHGVGFLW